MFEVVKHSEEWKVGAYLRILEYAITTVRCWM